MHWFLYSGIQLERPLSSVIVLFSMTITNVSNGHCQMSPSFHSSMLNPSSLPAFLLCWSNEKHFTYSQQLQSCIKSEFPSVTQPRKFQVVLRRGDQPIIALSGEYCLSWLDFPLKVCTRWMRALWPVVWRLYNFDLCKDTKSGLWSSFLMGKLIYHNHKHLHGTMRGLIYGCIKFS